MGRGVICNIAAVLLKVLATNSKLRWEKIMETFCILYDVLKGMHEI